LQPGRVVAIMTPQRGRRVALRAERQAAQRAALETQRIQEETLSKVVAAYRQRKETARAAVTDSTLMSIATGREAEGTNAESGESSSDEESCGVVANGPKPMRIVDGSDGNEADQQVDDSGDDDNDDSDDDDDEDSDKDLFEFDNPVADSGFDESDPVAVEARQVAAKAASERRRYRWAWGVVINVSRRFVTDESLVLDVLLPCRVSKLGSTTVPEPPPLPSLEAKCASFGNKPPTTCVKCQCELSCRFSSFLVDLNLIVVQHHISDMKSSRSMHPWSTESVPFACIYVHTPTCTQQLNGSVCIAL
jgi:hypothetical protein